MHNLFKFLCFISVSCDRIFCSYYYIHKLTNTYLSVKSWLLPLYLVSLTPNKVYHIKVFNDNILNSIVAYSMTSV